MHVGVINTTAAGSLISDPMLKEDALSIGTGQD
jgi:hypothetical protein